MTLVGTDLAVQYVIDMPQYEGLSRKSVRQSLYHWARVGKVTRHGGSSKGQALWSLEELHAAMGFTCPESVVSCRE